MWQAATIDTLGGWCEPSAFNFAMMEYSKHNIFGQLQGSDQFYLVNPLSRQADLLTPEQAELYRTGRASENAEFAEKGYVVDPLTEQRAFRSAYLQFVDDREQDEVQLFFVPWYDCNFSCTYCFQDEYTNPRQSCPTDLIDRFFAYIDSEFAGRRKYITIFGGEPLMPNQGAKDTFSYICAEAAKRSLTLAVVTNGYTLEEYLPLLAASPLREVQVTLDGTGAVHDARRAHKGGRGSFEQIARGISLLLQNNIAVNLRMVVDKENIGELPVLARFAIDNGWTVSPHFKTQLGRNYELHHCQEQSERLFTRLGLYEKLFGLLHEFPHIAEFHRPAFSISKFLFDNGQLPEPLFDSCPGAKTEWAFDYTGAIYSCTAMVGKAGEELGRFYPEVVKNTKAIEEWEERDVLTIAQCTTCNLRLACGGGCAAVAKVQTGSLHGPDCRPVDGLLGLGLAHYFA